MHQISKRRHICGRRFSTQKSMKIYGTDLKCLDNAIDQQQRLAQQMRRRKPKLGTKPQRRGDPHFIFILNVKTHVDENLKRPFTPGIRSNSTAQTYNFISMKVIPRTKERKGADLEGRSSDGTVDSESALRSAETILSRVQAPPPALWHDGRPKSLGSFVVDRL
ncbi:hypothetical protein PoB_005851900 [Plakobranchus ocellatus]|uniref:Uncharacterized protein n=1 Tax=Plakobranchus ocellatus TaxID=259542 RepID=A0AAV4CGZ3_9GAST|nr:hypothetical protein PoB_005851900 [Plakobranchus ocellatus]